MRSELRSPLASTSFVEGTISLVDHSDVRDKGVIGVGVCEEGGDRQEDSVDGEGGAPLVLQDVQADVALGVDVGVVHLCCEFYLGRLEGVVCGEVDGQVEDAACIWRALGADDGGGPLADVRAAGPCADVGQRVLLQVSDLLVDAFDGSHPRNKQTLTNALFFVCFYLFYFFVCEKEKK